MKTPNSLGGEPQGEPSSEQFASSLELKELFSVFEEQREDRSRVLDVIEHALMEPIPDLSDPAAVEEYNAKMETLKNMAALYAARADELSQIWEQIESHIITLPRSSD